MPSDRSYNNEKPSAEENHEDEEGGGIKDPKPMPYLFEKELINNQNKRVYVVDDFGPSTSIHYITAKYYARHEQAIPTNHKQYRSFVDRPPLIQHRTENNVYGWMPASVKSTRLLSQLNFVAAPKQRCPFTVYGEIVQSDRITERPPFNGLRFYLQ